MQERVDLRATAMTVEVLYQNQRVASHLRSYAAKGHATIAAEHRPRSHREYGDWPPERLVRWAETIGPQVGALVATMLRAEPHPELRYRACLGLLRLGKTYGPARLETACARALALGSPRYRTVAEMLKRRLESAPLPDTLPLDMATSSTKPPELTHDDVRGSHYFDKEETQ
jgi:hypothetical protein